MEPPTFSLIPGTDGIVHAVLDFIIRAAYLDPGLVKLHAVCGDEVRPEDHLPPAPTDALCSRCCQAMPENTVPRPGPGSPMLRDLARLHAELTR